jgi:hypothetical protein
MGGAKRVGGGASKHNIRKREDTKSAGAAAAPHPLPEEQQEGVKKQRRELKRLASADAGKATRKYVSQIKVGFRLLHVALQCKLHVSARMYFHGNAALRALPLS